MKKSMLLAWAALLLAASPAMGQSTISQGMSPDQVRARFGEPATTRAQGEWSYWYYHNGCPIRCGSDDVVFFQNDRVVAAVLRTSRRRFSGPAADEAISGAAGGATGVGDEQRSNDAPAGRATVGGVRMEGGVRPRAREGQPGEASTIVITPEAQRAREAAAGAPVNQAREGRPGEPSSIIITTPPQQGDPAPAADTNPPAVDNPLPVTPPADAQTPADVAPAENTEAVDTRGETSIDRKNRRIQQDRANEPTATQRARRNDARNP